MTTTKAGSRAGAKAPRKTRATSTSTSAARSKPARDDEVPPTAPRSRKTAPKAERRSRKTSVQREVSLPKDLGEVRFELDQSLSIAGVRSLREDLEGACSDCTSVVLDGTRIQILDTAALQVLLGFVRDCEDRGVGTRWAGESEALIRSAALLGLAADLGLSTAP